MGIIFNVLYCISFFIVIMPCEESSTIQNVSPSLISTLAGWISSFYRGVILMELSFNIFIIVLSDKILKTLSY